MPQLGADMTAGKLLRWRKTVGDRIQRGEIIADVETDKADIEVEVFTTGVIEELATRATRGRSPSRNHNGHHSGGR